MTQLTRTIKDFFGFYWTVRGSGTVKVSKKSKEFSYGGMMMIHRYSTIMEFITCQNCLNRTDAKFGIAHTQDVKQKKREWMNLGLPVKEEFLYSPWCNFCIQNISDVYKGFEVFRC